MSSPVRQWQCMRWRRAPVALAAAVGGGAIRSDAALQARRHRAGGRGARRDARRHRPADPRSFYVDQPFRQVAHRHRLRGARRRRQRHSARSWSPTTPRSATCSRRRFDVPPASAGRAEARAAALDRRARRRRQRHDRPDRWRSAPSSPTTPSSPSISSTQRCGGQSCDANQACCAGACTNVQADPANCGGCGIGCAPGGDCCSGATCRCAGGSACARRQHLLRRRRLRRSAERRLPLRRLRPRLQPGRDLRRAARASAAPAPPAPPAPCAAPTAPARPRASARAARTSCSFPDVCCGGTTCVDSANRQQQLRQLRPQPAPRRSACADGACACNGAICARRRHLLHRAAAPTSTTIRTTAAPAAMPAAPARLCRRAVPVRHAAVRRRPALLRRRLRQTRARDELRQPAATRARWASLPGGHLHAATAARLHRQPDLLRGRAAGGAGCFDPSNDPKHCGDCATQCPPGDACTLGKCAPTLCNPPCTNGNSCVGGAVPLQRLGRLRRQGDLLRRRLQGSVDRSGQLQPVRPASATGTRPTAATAVCTAPSAANCAACGKPCGTNQSCCVCAGMAPTCSGVCLCLCSGYGCRSRRRR